ncbi:hypothetical protein [Ornithinibacillus halophilus]|uniref:Cytochrome b561 n=1 Tax=Ornithinibacillus halophilus TaxID=930117 RepID=A0A1M5IIV1_9BACI|nr:hypothetical protein [Ornithinibacillus halophilus]SHG27979.1 hypothetical protein SAMN05216225_102427 [Ornithinibacillus halophilus]
MSYWFVLNIFLLIFAIWQVVTHALFPALPSHVIVGFIGFLFFLFNWTRNAVFATIRTVPERKKKIKLANLSKKVLPFHRWTGTTALLLIIVHAIMVISNLGFTMKNEKMLVGLLALIIMVLLVFTGWYRLIKPSGTVRKIHLWLGMSLFMMIAIHLLL